jgi:hypothetical protein
MQQIKALGRLDHSLANSLEHQSEKLDCAFALDRQL